MDQSTSVRECALPGEALLGEYARKGAYTDCFSVMLPRVVAQAEYVEAFYTTALFKVERWLIARFLSRPSTDLQVQQLALGSANSFAAWSVEQRQPNQIVLAVGRTRSWLMTSPVAGAGASGTQLYFGSAVVRQRDGGTGRAAMGWQFRALLGFHKLYSRALLSAAVRKLGVVSASPSSGDRS